MASPIISQVQVCNSALLKVGTDIISDINEGARAAVICRTLFAYLQDEVMAASPWRFATRSVVLYPNGNTPPFTYTFAYDIPQDCLRLLSPDDDALIWKVEDGGDWSNDEVQILSNESSLNMRYIFRQNDYSQWTSLFAETLAWRIAMELALSITRSIPMKQECEKSYKEALAQARAINAVIGTPVPLEADIWSKARRGYKYWRPSAGQVGDDPNYDP